MPKRKPRRPNPDPSVAAFEAVARLTGRDDPEDSVSGEDGAGKRADSDQGKRRDAKRKKPKDA